MTGLIVNNGHQETHHTLIVPGRRALGETWRKVTIGANSNEITVQNEPHEAPADGKPIMAMGVSDETHIREILQAQLGKAAERAGKQVDELTAQERFDQLNEAWFAFLEQKLRWMRGQTTIGPGGMQQREKTHQNPETRPYWNRGE